MKYVRQFIATLSLAAVAAVSSPARAAYPPGISTNGDTSATTVTAAGASTVRSLSSLMYDGGVNPRWFGATIDGTYHSVSSTLGCSTIATCSAITVKGATPYAWLADPLINAEQSDYMLLSSTASGATQIVSAKTTTEAVAQASATAGLDTYIVPSAGCDGVRIGDMIASGSNTAQQIYKIVPHWISSTDSSRFNCGLLTTGTISNATHSVGDVVTIYTNWDPKLVGAYAFYPGAFHNTNSYISHSTAGLTTVTSVNATPGEIDFSAPTTASTGAFYHIEFLRPYSDSETAAKSMDDIGYESAFNYSSTNGYKRVLAPAGTSYFTSNLIIPDGYTSGGTSSIDFIGEGANQAFLVDNDASGGMNYPRNFVACYMAFSVDGCEGAMRDMTVTSAFSASTAGYTASLITGVDQGSHRYMSYVNIGQGFYIGIGLKGDHATFTNIQSLSGSYIGMMKEATNDNRHDNYTFDKINFTRHRFAGIAVEPNTAINGSLFTGSIFADAPFGIYKMEGGNTSGIVTDTVLNDNQFELVGECGICSSRNAFIMQSYLTNDTFKDTEWYFANTTTQPEAFIPNDIGIAFTNGAYVMVNNLTGTVFDHTMDEYTLSNTGQLGMFDFSVGNVTFIDDIDNMYAKAGSGGVGTGRVFFTSSSWPYVRLISPVYSGQPANSAGVAPGSSLCQTAAPGAAAAYGACTGSPSDQFAGVVSKTLSNGEGLLITHGTATVNAIGPVAVNANNTVRTACYMTTASTTSGTTTTTYAPTCTGTQGTTVNGGTTTVVTFFSGVTPTNPVCYEKTVTTPTSGTPTTKIQRGCPDVAGTTISGGYTTAISYSYGNDDSSPTVGNALATTALATPNNATGAGYGQVTVHVADTGGLK